VAEELACWRHFEEILGPMSLRCLAESQSGYFALLPHHARLVRHTWVPGILSYEITLDWSRWILAVDEGTYLLREGSQLMVTVRPRPWQEDPWNVAKDSGGKVSRPLICCGKRQASCRTGETRTSFVAWTGGAGRVGNEDRLAGQKFSDPAKDHRLLSSAV